MAGRETRTGGAYVPPFKAAQLLHDAASDKDSVVYQRATWDALRKSINGLVNKVRQVAAAAPPRSAPGGSPRGGRAPPPPPPPAAPNFPPERLGQDGLQV